jgi:hypothetical protein
MQTTGEIYVRPLRGLGGIFLSLTRSLRCGLPVSTLALRASYLPTENLWLDRLFQARVAGDIPLAHSASCGYTSLKEPKPAKRAA